MGGRRAPGTLRKFAWLPRVHGCGQHRRPNKVCDNIFHVFFTLQNFAFLSVVKFCVVRVSLMPGRVTAKHHVDVRNPHIYFCEKCKMIDLMDGHKLCGQRKLEEVRNNNFHVFFILQKFAFFHVAKIRVARVSLLPGRATQLGRGHVRTALLLVSASAESAHAPHSSHISTNEGERTRRHLPDDDCSGLTQGQKDSNRARTIFWRFPLSFPLGNAGTSSCAPAAPGEVPAFPN